MYSIQLSPQLKLKLESIEKSLFSAAFFSILIFPKSTFLIVFI